MRLDFSFEVKRESEYDYINGRVKVLEMNLLKEDFLNKTTSLSFDGFIKELEQTVYKQYINPATFSGISEGLTKRLESELHEFEKFLSEGFINSFFRSKEVFLSVRQFALGRENLLDNDFRNFLSSGKGSYPEEFRECYNDVGSLKDSPILTGLAVGSYYLRFLRSASFKTKEPMVIRYYDIFLSSYFIATALRLFRFIDRKAISEEFFNESVSYMKRILDGRGILQEINDYETFKRFLGSERAYYGSVDLRKTSARQYILQNLREIIEKAKTINTGILPSFIYLSRLSLEVEELLSIIQLREKGFEEVDEIYQGVLYG